MTDSTFPSIQGSFTVKVEDSLAEVWQDCFETGPSEAAYLKLSPSEAEFGSKSSELSRVEFAFRVGQKLPPPPSF